MRTAVAASALAACFFGRIATANVFGRKYEFSTQKAAPRGKVLRYRKLEAQHVNKAGANLDDDPKDPMEDLIEGSAMETEEDKIFWERMMQEVGGSVPGTAADPSLSPAPTPAGNNAATAGSTPASTPGGTNATTPTQAPMILLPGIDNSGRQTASPNATVTPTITTIQAVTPPFGQANPQETVAPTPNTAGTEELLCVPRVEVDCVEAATGFSCSELGDECLVNVTFTYEITNDGSEAEQVYSLSVLRGDVATVVTTLVEEIDDDILEPGETNLPAATHKMDLCGPKGLGVLDTKADILTGPPTFVEVELSCKLDETEIDCQDVSDNNACLLDVVYTYEVTNTGSSDFNIIFLDRDRSGGDLASFLGSEVLLGVDTFLEVGASLVVKERDQVDLCQHDETFSTRAIVQVLPPAATLCQDTDFYLSG